MEFQFRKIAVFYNIVVNLAFQIGKTSSKETRLSATVSRKIRGFDQTNIFKALDELDRRRELQLGQQRKMIGAFHLDFNLFSYLINDIFYLCTVHVFRR